MFERRQKVAIPQWIGIILLSVGTRPTFAGTNTASLELFSLNGGGLVSASSSYSVISSTGQESEIGMSSSTDFSLDSGFWPAVALLQTCTPGAAGLQDCNNNGLLDACDISDGTSLDCNNNAIPDECDIADCSGSPACDDCNNNGVPDSCDITAGTSMDVDANGIPDECEVWDDEAGDNNWSTDANWLDNTAPSAGDMVVIDGNLAFQANVNLDVPATIDVLRLRNNATLNVTGAAGQDLTLTGTGGVFLTGPEVGTPQASLLVANDRAISVANGPAILNATALYQAAAGSSNVSASLGAATIEIHEGFPPGEMVLSDSMSVTTTGDFVFRYQPEGHNLLPAPCSVAGVTQRGGAIDRPRLRAFDTSSISIGGDLIVRGGADIIIGPGVSFVVGGSIINEVTVCPNEVDLSKATLILGGSPLRSPAVGMQHFEVAGQDFGANAQGFADNFAVGGLIVSSGTDVSFVDQFDNNGNGTPDALYVGNIVFDSGSVITIDNSKVFYNVLTNNATSVTLLGTGELTAIASPAPVAPLASTSYPHAVAKNRYLSIVPNPGNIAVPHTYQITHVGSGQSFFISPPRTTPPEIAGLGYTFVVSDMDTAGLLFDYATLPVVHVGGCLIAPGETYEIRASTDGVNFSVPLTVTTATVPTNGRFWGDAVGVFSAAGDTSTTPATPAGAWTPPDGTMNGFDVTAALRGFQKMDQPDNTWTDVNGLSQDRLTNGNDILRFVNAFSVGGGKDEYPFPTPASCTTGPDMDIPPVVELAP